jgi:hypothetical protein
MMPQPELQTLLHAAMPRYNCKILKYRGHQVMIWVSNKSHDCTIIFNDVNHAYQLISAPGLVSLKGDNLWCHLISIQVVLIQ